MEVDCGIGGNKVLIIQNLLERIANYYEKEEEIEDCNLEAKEFLQLSVQHLKEHLDIKEPTKQ